MIARTPNTLTTLTARQNARTGRTVRAVETNNLPTRPGLQRRYSVVPGAGILEVLIAGNMVISPNRWLYSWIQAMVDSAGLWIPKPGGQTSTVGGDPFVKGAMNAYENNNDGIGPEGAGGTYGVVGSSSRIMLPIMTGAWVQIFTRKDANNNVRYYFARENAPEVSCV